MRGPVLDLAMKVEKRLKEGGGKEALPFSEMIYCNIGKSAVGSGGFTHTSHLSLSHHVHPNTTADTHGTGNPQSLKQQPLTYIRQVLSLVVNPLLLEKHADLVRRGYEQTKEERRVHK